MHMLILKHEEMNPGSQVESRNEVVCVSFCMLVCLGLMAYPPL